MASVSSFDNPQGGKKSSNGKHAAVGYVRRSTNRQDQSIPDQKRAIECYAEENGFPLLRFYVDDAVSGTSTVGRKAFQALVDDARRSHSDFNVVIVYDVKRFGRVDNDEAGYYRYILRTHGVEIHYVTENFTGDGTDDLLRPVKQWQAREESKDLAKVVIRGQLSRATDGQQGGRATGGGGWWMGGAPPYGFDLRYESQNGEFLLILRYMRDGSKQVLNENGKTDRTLDRKESLALSRRDRCNLAPGDRSRVEVVRQIFRMYVENGIGIKAIADALNRQRIPSPRGPAWAAHYLGRWSMTTIHGILVNPAHCGDMAWNRHTDARFFRIAKGQAVERLGTIRRRLEPNDKSDWIVVRDAHEAIVSRRTWDRVQVILRQRLASRRQSSFSSSVAERVNERTPQGGWTGPRAKFLLSGLISCSHCGSRYEGYTRNRNQRDEHGQSVKTLHYACGGYIRGGRKRCTLGAYPRDVVEAAVIEAIIDAFSHYRLSPGREEEARSLAAKLIDRQIGVDQKAALKRRRFLRSRLEKIEMMTSNLIDSLSPVNRVPVDRRLTELESERQQIETDLISLKYNSCSAEEIRTMICEATQFADRLSAVLNDDDIDHRKAAVRQCVQSIVIDRDRNRATVTIRELPALIGIFDDPLTTDSVVLLSRPMPGRPTTIALPVV